MGRQKSGPRSSKSILPAAGGRCTANGAAAAVEGYAAADEVGIAAVTTLPQTVAENDDLIFSEFILFLLKRAAEHWLRTDDLKVTRCNYGPLQLLWITVAGERHRQIGRAHV